jgi:hypothetical protein
MEKGHCRTAPTAARNLGGGSGTSPQHLRRKSSSGRRRQGPSAAAAGEPQGSGCAPAPSSLTSTFLTDGGRTTRQRRNPRQRLLSATVIQRERNGTGRVSRTVRDGEVRKITVHWTCSQSHRQARPGQNGYFIFLSEAERIPFSSSDHLSYES